MKLYLQWFKTCVTLPLEGAISAHRHVNILQVFFSLRRNPQKHLYKTRDMRYGSHSFFLECLADFEQFQFN